MNRTTVLKCVVFPANNFRHVFLFMIKFPGNLFDHLNGIIYIQVLCHFRSLTMTTIVFQPIIILLNNFVHFINPTKIKKVKKSLNLLPFSLLYLLPYFHKIYSAYYSHSLLTFIFSFDVKLFI